MTSGITRETLVHINEALSEQMGLRFPENRLADLERGLVVACQAMGWGGPDHCITALRESRLSREQVELLASHLTIGETYFYREPKSFEALEEVILPRLIERRRQSNRILRFWSAGCSSGEEAYTIAILLQRMIPDWQEWGITILATDINPDALSKAEEGVYGDWSFRGRGKEFKERYCTPAGKKRYRIKDEIRKMVRFTYLNLAEDASYPSIATNTQAMDVIFCRNVLMYFAPDTIRSVTRRFYDALTDGGWVITSPSEASDRFFEPFQTVNFPGAIFFRKTLSLAAPQPVSSPEETRDEGQPERREEWRKRAAAARERTAVKQSITPEKAPVEEKAAYEEIEQLLLEGENQAVIERLRGGARGVRELEFLARARANTGNLPKALDCCERALRLDPLAVRFHYLKAGILQEMGAGDDAAMALRKTLFLEKDFAMAHFTLANIYRQLGKRTEARRHFRRAESLFSKMSPEATPSEAEGMNAARLCQMTAANLRSLEYDHA